LEQKMNRYESLEVPFASLSVISGTTSSSGEKIHPIHSERTGSTPISEAIDAYMLAYCGKDQTRGQRMAWWQ
jgi:hypothetical protein